MWSRTCQVSIRQKLKLNCSDQWFEAYIGPVFLEQVSCVASFYKWKWQDREETVQCQFPMKSGHHLLPLWREVCNHFLLIRRHSETSCSFGRRVLVCVDRLSTFLEIRQFHWKSNVEQKRRHRADSGWRRDQRKQLEVDDLEVNDIFKNEIWIRGSQ